MLEYTKRCRDICVIRIYEDSRKNFWQKCSSCLSQNRVLCTGEDPLGRNVSKRKDTSKRLLRCSRSWASKFSTQTIAAVQNQFWLCNEDARSNGKYEIKSLKINISWSGSAGRIGLRMAIKISYASQDATGNTRACVAGSFRNYACLEGGNGPHCHCYQCTWY